MLTNQRIGLKMQVDVYHSILQQDIEYWDVHDTDEAFDTLWASADCVDDIMRCPNDLLSMLSNIISTSYILYTKNKSLLYIMMLLTPAQMIVQHYLSGLDYYVSRKAWKKNINSRSDWGEVLDSKNFRTVRSFVREPREVKMFQQELEQETETRATSSALRSLFEPIQSIVGQSSELMGLFYGGRMVVDGTLEADAITVNGVTLAETISDTVGGMVAGNTETGVAVTYEDSDNTLDFVLGATQTTVTSLKNAALVIGRDADNDIDFSTDNNIVFRAGGADQVKLIDGVFSAGIDSDVDLGTTAVRFKDAFVDSITVTGAVTANSLDIEGNVDVNGILETDALTIAGISLSESIADTVGAMVGGNTESGISVTYNDSDNTLDFDVIDPTITLTGDVTGSATMTNLGSVSIATTRTAGSTSTADIADNAITEAKVVNDAISRAKLKDEVSFLIINAAGSTVKSLYGAGS